MSKAVPPAPLVIAKPKYMSMVGVISDKTKIFQNTFVTYDIKHMHCIIVFIQENHGWHFIAK